MLFPQTNHPILPINMSSCLPSRSTFFECPTIIHSTWVRVNRCKPPPPKGSYVEISKSPTVFFCCWLCISQLWLGIMERCVFLDLKKKARSCGYCFTLFLPDPQTWLGSSKTHVPHKITGSFAATINFTNQATRISPGPASCILEGWTFKQLIQPVAFVAPIFVAHAAQFATKTKGSMNLLHLGI